MGEFKQHGDIKYESNESEKVYGILGSNKLSQNNSIKNLIKERRARLDKFNSQDMKTFLTAEEKQRAFGGKKGRGIAAMLQE